MAFRLVVIAYCVSAGLLFADALPNIGTATCSTIPQLCGLSAQANGLLSVSAPGAAYGSPTYLSSDSMSEAGSINGYSGSASGNFTASFSGIHFYGAAQANNTAAGSEAAFNLRIVDYFVVSGAPAGSVLTFNYSADAIGSSYFDSLGILQYGTAFGVDSETYRFSDGTTRTVPCIPSTNPAESVYINGAVSQSCSQSVGLSSPFDIVQFGLFTTGFAIAENGSTVLDATNTISLNSIQVTDSFGNILPDIQIEDLSGFNYDASAGSGTPPSAAPEADSMLMVASGVILLFVLRRDFLRAWFIRHSPPSIV